MLHNDDVWAELVLDDLRKYSSECCLNLNEPTKKIVEIVEKYEKKYPGFIVKKIFTSNSKKWNQGLQRENTVRMLDDIMPDIVLFPDSDEVFPSNFGEQLLSFYNDSSKESFWLRLLYLWGDKRHFRNDGFFKRIHHVRCFKWSSEVSFLSYMGYACPTNLIKKDKSTRFHSNSPMIHYGYINEFDRKRKIDRMIGWFSDDNERAVIDKNMLILPVPEDIIT